MAIIVRNVPRHCAAEGCYEPILHERLMCEYHRGLIPQQIQDELRSTYAAMKTGGPRYLYLAARMRAIIAVAEIENRTVSQSVRNVLHKIESGEWFHAAKQR